jgi:hypothetical protein
MSLKSSKKAWADVLSKLPEKEAEMRRLYRDKLIAAGIKNLREFGYPSCDEKNILTDMIFSRFFEMMLKETKGQAGKDIDEAVDALLKEIDERLLPKDMKGKKGKKGKAKR